MGRFPCPICGDPTAYPIWIDKEPPEGCPHDEAWHAGGKPSITDVTQCSYSMNKARQRAEWRKALPEAFDGSGNLKDGRLADVLLAWREKYPASSQTLYI